MKQILMINRNGETQVNPEACKHENTTQFSAGHRWAIAGDVTDDIRILIQCLDCGEIIGGELEPKPSKEIPY